MHDLRALMGVCAWGLIATPVQAAMQTFSSELVGQSVSGGGDPIRGLGSPAVSQLKQTLGYEAQGVAGAWTLASSLTSAHPDYSSYLLTQRNGSQVALSDRVGSSTELSAGASLGWDQGSHSASFNWSGSLTTSPFSFQSLGMSWNESFAERTTVLGLRARASVMNQPESYFIGIDYVTRARPKMVHANEIAATVDQVLSERLKVGLEVETSDREEDRPRNVGGTLSTAYAWGDRVFSRLALSRLEELRSWDLRDERGYFSLNAVELGSTFEPWVDCLLTPSYAWVLEEESDPRTGRAVRVGSDQLGFAARWRQGAWELELRSLYRMTNTDLRDFSLGGGVKWRI